MAELDNYVQNNIKHTFNSDKFNRNLYINWVETSLSTNIYHSDDNRKKIRMSKISFKLSESSIDEQQSEAEIIEMEIKKSNYIFNNMTSKVNSVDVTGSIILPEEIVVNLVLKDENDNILLKKIFVPINENETASDIIKKSIFQFNRLFKYERIQVMFSTNEFEKFSLKPSKKNGLPNYDLPGNNSLLIKFSD